VPQSEQSGDGDTIFSSQPDLNLIAHTFDQVADPKSGLGKQLMAFPRDQQKPVELTNKLLRMARFIRKLLLFCTPDFSLDAVLVESLKKLFQARLQVKLMEAVGAARAQARVSILNL
jgi:hypothetical protein